jgi:hypothetical protein
MHRAAAVAETLRALLDGRRLRTAVQLARGTLSFCKIAHDTASHYMQPDLQASARQGGVGALFCEHVSDGTQVVAESA